MPQFYSQAFCVSVAFEQRRQRTPSTCTLNRSVNYASAKRNPLVLLRSQKVPTAPGGVPPNNGSIPPRNRGEDPNNSDSDPDPSNKDMNIFTLYLNLLDRYALPTKMLTSAFLTFLSDAIAQLFETRDSPAFDKRRLLSLFLVGGLLTAPLFHYLYEYLEFLIPVSATPLNVVLQLAIDQLLAGPAWLLGFFALVPWFEGRFTRDSFEKQIDRDLVPALKLTWTIFPPVQLISFAFLPPMFRLLTLNVVDLIYTTVLSYIKHRPIAVS